MSMTLEEASRILTYLKDKACSKAERVAISMAVSALRPVSREQVEKVWKGEWVYDKDGYLVCSHCGFHPTYSQNSKDKKGLSNCRFCPNCGDAKTDEAVNMVMDRLEALHDNRT